MIRFTADAYVADVVAGRVMACRWVRLACERHLRDLVDGPARGIWFDERTAKMMVAFFSLLHHWKGEWAGRPVTLEPWQQFVIASLFGWKRKADGTRRFRTGYLEVARKNGKTTLAAGVGLGLMVVDGEPGAEVYTAATKRDQARIAHRDATEMVKRSPELKREVSSFKDNLHSLETSSKFQPLGRDADSLDGLNVHGVIADEVHAWPNRDLWDVLETATGARRQPLMLAITTAGSDRQSFCRSLHDYAERVLSGLVEDDSFWGIIYTLDDGDNWEDEKNWGKSNPNLAVSKQLDDMRRKAGRAKEMPAALNAFLRLELNVWTQADTRWMNPDKWRLCSGPVELEALRGRPCFGGLDLSSTIDITALVWVFPPIESGGEYIVVPRFFIPDENVMERVRRDRVPVDVWIREGLVIATPGNVVDYDWVLGQIESDMDLFDVQELAFDRWGSQKITSDLQSRLGFTVDEKVAKLQGRPLLVQFGQGFASMSAPMKELEKLVLSLKIAHGGNPVLSWMADNLVAVMDPAGNIKPDKARSREKIDGMVALIMGLARALLKGIVHGSVYAQRGLRVL